MSRQSCTVTAKPVSSKHGERNTGRPACVPREAGQRRRKEIGADSDAGPAIGAGEEGGTEAVEPAADCEEGVATEAANQVIGREEQAPAPLRDRPTARRGGVVSPRILTACTP